MRLRWRAWRREARNSGGPALPNPHRGRLGAAVWRFRLAVGSTRWSVDSPLCSVFRLALENVATGGGKPRRGRVSGVGHPCVLGSAREALKRPCGDPKLRSNFAPFKARAQFGHSDSFRHTDTRGS